MASAAASRSRWRARAPRWSSTTSAATWTAAAPTADPAAEVCKEIEALGSEGVPNYDSVAEFDSAGQIIKTALDTWKRCDILVNNAGILRDKSVANMAPEDFDAVLKVHLYGGFNCCRHALPVMREQGYGRIVNIVSSAGLRGNFGQANYGAAKAGLMGLTFVIAVEHMKGNAEGKYSITANALAPGRHDAHGRAASPAWKGGRCRPR